MTRVLLVGLKPEAVDYSDPALPAGMNAKKIQAAIDLGLKQMTDRGWQAEAAAGACPVGAAVCAP
jgi:hypothetical protein